MTSNLSSKIVSRYGRRFISFLVTAFVILYQTPLYPSDYTITTANLPPWSYDDGKSGIFPDIVAEIEKRLGENHPTIAAPWNRALMYVSEKDDYLMFPLTRTPERENHYRWLIKVMPYTMSFISFGGNKLNIDEAKQLDAVLVHQNSYPYKVLKDKGFKNIVKTTHWSMYGSRQGISSIIKRMKIGRVDAWFEATTVVKHITKGMTDSDKLVYGESIVEGSWLYIVGSKNLSDKLVDDYQSTFEEIKQDGTFDNIMEKYIGSE